MERRSAARGRRSKSLSRFPPPTPRSGDFETPRSRFVNKTRGSGQIVFGHSGEVSLDDLADEFLRARAESEEDEEDVFVVRGRAERRISLSNSNSSNKGSESSSGARYLRETASSKHRERSISRAPSIKRNHQSVGPTRGYNNNNNKSKTVMVRKSITSGLTRQNMVQKETNFNGGTMRRDLSQRDFLHSHDSSSTHSSLTDEEASRAVYAKKEQQLSEGEAGLYEEMRMEIRNAVEEIRTQLEKVMTKPEEAMENKTGEIENNDDIQPIQVIAEMRRNYTSKLEESEKRKQELLAELAAEEQRGQELSTIVKELLPSEKKNLNLPLVRRRSRERTRVSRHLTEEAERYFEDFLSNVEDTDFSSFDGERSDTSFNPKPNFQEFQENNSSLVSPKPNNKESLETPVLNSSSSPLVSESDGVVLPWLQWETCTSPSKTLKEGGGVRSNNVTSSHDSWSPDSVSTNKSISKFGGIKAKSSYCKEDYLDLKNSGDFLLERLRLRQRLESGGIVLCTRIML